ncbi:hypothetical protein QOT17_021202 [Balamuthia mandrillaris]
MEGQQQQQHRLPQWRLACLSMYGFARFSFFAASVIFLIPMQILHMAGREHKGTWVGVVNLLASLVSVLAYPVFGAWSDATKKERTGRYRFLLPFGRRRPFVAVGAAVWSLFLLVMGVTTFGAEGDLLWMPLFILMNTLANAADSLVSPAYAAMVPDVVANGQYGAASGWVAFSQTFGQLFGGGVIGFLLRYMHLYGVYLLLTILQVVCAVVTVAFVKELPGEPLTTAASQLVSEEAKDEESETENKEEEEEEEEVEESQHKTEKRPIIAKTEIEEEEHFGNAFALPSEQQRYGVVGADDEPFRLNWPFLRSLYTPFQDHNFFWVFWTRFLFTAGYAVITAYIFYFVEDVMHPPYSLLSLTLSDSSQVASCFVAVVTIGAILSALAAGVLSDHFGRKPLVYLSGVLMAATPLLIIFTIDFTVFLLAGFTFGIGYGCYASVDFALVSDVLPSVGSHAKDLGVWHLAFSLPSVVAPPIAGVTLDLLEKQSGQWGAWSEHIGYKVMLVAVSALLLFGAVFIKKVRLQS